VFAEQFLDAILPQLERLRTGQLAPIRQAGAIVADAIANGRRIWIARTTHCLHGEATYRAGGFMAAHILEDPIVLEPGDVVIEGTPAGTSGLVIDTAIAAKARGAALIALTQLVYERDPRILLQHPTGQRLHELADVVVDLGGCYGDGELDLPGEDIRILPSSGITGMTAMWMIFAEAVEQLLARELMPLMWQSMLVPGATERNERLRTRYLCDRVGYLPLVEVNVPEHE
jgi:uncharacterized phosphosugar-binding protein